MADVDRFCGEVGAFVQLDATLSVVRPFPSRFGASMVEHELIDGYGRTLQFWGDREWGEVGDEGTITGLVVACELHGGRSRTRLSKARFVREDRGEARFEEAVSDALDAARWGRSAAIRSANRRILGDEDEGEAPPAAATPSPRRKRPPAPDAWIVTRFRHLEMDEAEEAGGGTDEPAD